MTRLVFLALEPDTAGHVAVALRRHRSALVKNGLAEPPQLADLEALAVEVVKSTQQASGRVTVMGTADDVERDYFTRRDIAQRTGASLATIDRWIRSGDLPSSKHGRSRRVARTDLERFFAAARR